MAAADPTTLELLAGFLAGPPAPPSGSGGRSWPPTAGTLPDFGQRLGGGRSARELVTALRSFGQVIFINNPLSGLLLLLALCWQSAAMGLLAAIGVVAATLTAGLIGCERSVLRNGIYGFNGALVGCALGAFAAIASAPALLVWSLPVAAGAALTTLLVEHQGRWLVRHLGLPPLTLPFCLVTWLLLAMVAGWGQPALALVESTAIPASAPQLAPLLAGVVRGFGQVFLCPSLASGSLVLLAVAAASPLAALTGLAGGLASALTALAGGMDPGAVHQGLGSYNGVLTAIAIGGTFYATSRSSLLVALPAAAATSVISPALAGGLATINLPLLTLPFVLATMATMLALHRLLPSLLPVALHAQLTPEEHRRRLLVARTLLGDFRQRLRQAVGNGRRLALLPQAARQQRRQLAALFAALDRDGDGSLSLAELHTALLGSPAPAGPVGTGRPTAAQLGELWQRLDLDGDGRVDAEEFAELMLRLQRLHEGHERLLTYLAPVDADGNERLDAGELDRLLASVGQRPLEPGERRRLFGAQGGSLSWGRFIDLLLLT
ncbi:urea transporter [Cyanobium sp. CH-040]|uniref:urea transporter n=1 Tax=Cyanobium sp. CH-040 TaxID=2823708 RepID=UPI0020CECA70|nr:urea transporter [Cyanobium sp. CH-040]MCP9927675.1 urea transporter [Cyanobium sp. CH-040]